MTPTPPDNPNNGNKPSQDDINNFLLEQSSKFSDYTNFYDRELVLIGYEIAALKGRIQELGIEKLLMRAENRELCERSQLMEEKLFWQGKLISAQELRIIELENFVRARQNQTSLDGRVRLPPSTITHTNQ